MRIVRNTMACFSAVLLCAGCASTVQYAPFPEQSERISDATKARIYVVRPTVFGGAISMQVADGDRRIGKTGPNGYLCWERAPGNTEVIGESENTARLPLTVEQGKVYYIQQHVRMGFFIARNKMSRLSESEGKQALKKCKPPQLHH